MKKGLLFVIMLLCFTGKAQTSNEDLKTITPGLPVIGILLFDKVIMTELTAPIDVFAKPAKGGKKLFNVIVIAESYERFSTEEGLNIFPDYTFSNSPKLDVIIIPSSFNMGEAVKNRNIVDFIKKQNDNTLYTVSICSGASLIGEAGIADGKKIVTWIGGGADLKKNYPNLIVQDELKVSFVEDGKFMSSNGNLTSYISSLELLEKMTSTEHRKYVEAWLYLDRLRNWKK